MAAESYRCLHCGGEIEPNRQRCRECGRGLEEVPRPSAERQGRVAQWPVIVLFLLVLGGAVGGIRWARSLSLPLNPQPNHEDQVVRQERLTNQTDAPADSTPVVPGVPPARLLLPRPDQPMQVHTAEPAPPPSPREPVRLDSTASVTGRSVAPLPELPLPRPVEPPSEAAGILHPAEPPRPPPAPPVIPVPKPQPEAAPAIPAQGTILWSGSLRKNEEIVIDGPLANRGTLTGALPGVPVFVSLDSRDFGFAEMPGPSNGWKRLVLRSRTNRNSVTIRWTLLR